MPRSALHKLKHNRGRAGLPDRSNRQLSDNPPDSDAENGNDPADKRYVLPRSSAHFFESNPILVESLSATQRPLERFLPERQKYLSIRDRTFASTARFRPRRSQVPLRSVPCPLACAPCLPEAYLRQASRRWLSVPHACL